MEKYVNKKNLGTFKINDENYIGELELIGSKTLLTIWDNGKPLPNEIGSNTKQIHGSFHDLSKVTLIDNGLFERGGFNKRIDENSYSSSRYIKIDPNYVLVGNEFINVDDCCFQAIEFHFPNSNDLFYFNSVTEILDVKEENVRKLIAADYKSSRDKFIKHFKFGDYPKVFVFTGADILHEFKTFLGQVIIRNNPSYTLGINSGFNVENIISCTIQFENELPFWNAVQKINPLLKVFELFLGKKQEINTFKLHCLSSNEFPDTYNVYHAFDMKNGDDKNIHPLDRLVQIEKDPDEFETIVRQWLNTNEEWKFARSEYFRVFNNRHYTTEKLIKLANLFDIIPDSAYNNNEELSKDILKAKKQCKDIFKTLPDSIERSSILGALGRIGKKNLKHKIKDRAQLIIDSGLVDLVDIQLIIKHSVDCRNYYVHGGNPRFDYLDNFNEFCFFIDTLEFIYGVSELLEMGWKFRYWKADELNQHPFSYYIISYKERLSMLKNVVEN